MIRSTSATGDRTWHFPSTIFEHRTARPLEGSASPALELISPLFCKEYLQRFSDWLHTKECITSVLHLILTLVLLHCSWAILLERGNINTCLLYKYEIIKPF